MLFSPLQGHSWDQLQNRGTTLFALKNACSWTGSVCYNCRAFRVSRKFSKKYSNFYILGLDRCPGPRVDWLTAYREVLLDKVNSGQLQCIRYNELCSWGFLPQDC